MSLAVITDSSVNLPAEIQGHADVYVLDIPVIIEGQPFVEGKNLNVNQFYAQMANSEELLKTSQPNLADLDNLLMELEEEGYTHVIGLFLSSGISGFWANSQFLIEDHAKLKIAFPDTKITAAPMGAMVRNVLHWSTQGMSFENILKKLEEQVDQTTAYILVDDLNHRQAPSQMDSTYLVNLGVRPNTSAPSPKCVAITAHKDTTVETLIPCASSCLLKSSAFSGAFV